MNTCPNGHGALQHQGNADICPVCHYSFVVPKKHASKAVEEVNKTIRNLWMEFKIGMEKGEKHPSFIHLNTRNYDSGKEYRGINRWITAMYPDISFITEKSIEKHGLSIPSTPPVQIVAWIVPHLTKKEQQLPKSKQDELLKRKHPFMVTHLVYMSKDVPGLEEKTYPLDKNIRTFDSIDSFIESTGVTIMEGGNTPTYDADSDTIVIPRHQQYDSTEEYYREVFRQLSYASGAEKRLGRDDKKFQKGIKYGKEHLIAEFSSIYMCNMFGIEPSMNVIQELDSWFEALDRDPYLLVSATQQAEKVFDYFFKK